MLVTMRAADNATLPWGWPAALRRSAANDRTETLAARVLLLAEGGEPTVQALRCLRLAGAQVHVLGRPAAAALRWSGDCRSVELFDFHPQANPTEISAERIEALIGRRGIDVVVPVGDIAAELLGRLRDRLPARCFPLAPQAAIRRLNDLAWFYELCRKLGLPMPRSVVVDHKHRIDVPLVGEAFGFPVAVRPCSPARGAEVVVAHSAHELRAQVIDNPDYDDVPLVVQERVEGEKVDLNLIAVNGEILAHCTQSRTGAAVTFRREPVLFAHARALMEVTRYSGLAHLKAIRDVRNGRVRLLACRGRMWGSMAASAECGVNLPAIGVAHALGQSLQPRHIPDGTVVPPSAPGLTERLAGLAGGLLRG